MCECISVHCMLSRRQTYCLSRRSSCHGATSVFSEGAAQVCQLVKLYLAALLSTKSSFGVTKLECILGHIILGKQVFRRCHGLELKSIAAWIFEEHCPLFTRLTCIVISHHDEKPDMCTVDRCGICIHIVDTSHIWHRLTYHQAGFAPV